MRLALVPFRARFCSTLSFGWASRRDAFNYAVMTQYRRCSLRPLLPTTQASCMQYNSRIQCTQVSIFVTSVQYSGYNIFLH